MSDTPKGRPLNFHFSVFTEGDAPLNTAPHEEQLARVVDILIHGQWKGADPETADLVVHMPFGRFRILDIEKGGTEPYEGEYVGIPGMIG